jgi:uncharacterized repeat protein (TIGR02543 family)
MKRIKSSFWALIAVAAVLFGACLAVGTDSTERVVLVELPGSKLIAGVNDAEGTAIVDPEDWQPGDVVTVTITAQEGYEIVSYAVVNGGAGNVSVNPAALRTTTAIISGIETSDDTRVVASFVRVYKLRFISDGNGTIAGTYWNDASHGSRARAYETVTFTAQSASESKRLSTLTCILSDGGSYSLDTDSVSDEYSFTMPASDVTVSAGFAARSSFIVTFDKNSGVVDTFPTTKTVESVVGELPAQPGRPDYSFLGWNKARDGGGDSVNRYTPVTGNITVYAQWLLIGANQFPVGFDPSGGSVEPLTIMVPKGKSAAEAGLSLPEAEKTGYNFEGWWAAAGGTGAPFTTSDIITGPVTVYAKWAAKTTAISFSMNDGNGLQGGVTATYGAALPLISVSASRTGYTFIGYFDAEDGGTQYYAGNGAGVRVWDKEEDAATLFARWTVKTSLVTFNMNGGSGAQGGVTATYGEAMPPITVAASRTGNSFTGYFDAGGGGNPYYDANGASVYNWDKETSTVPLYAHWTPLTYMITNGTPSGATGKISSISGTKQYQQQITVLTEPAAGYKLASITVFPAPLNGPTYDADGVKADFTMPAANVNVTALFESARCTLSFDTDGGGTIYPQTVDSGAQVSRPADPAKSGYAFTGWYSASSSGTLIGWPLTVSADRTIYARWGEITVSGVSVTPTNETVERGGASRQFAAVVAGANGPSQGVNWSLSGASSTGTGISTSGLLTVAADESAETLTVRATSTADSSKSGTASVPLEGGTAGLSPGTPW